MARPATGATTFSVATTQPILDSIDANAEKQGLSRSAYVLQWLPDNNPSTQQPATEHTAKRQTLGLERARIARSRSAV